MLNLAQSQHLPPIMTQEHVSSCLIHATKKEQVGKLKLVDVGDLETSFASKMNIAFPFKNRYFSHTHTYTYIYTYNIYIKCLILLYVYMLSLSVHWGINPPPSKAPSPSFLPSPP